MDQDRRDAMHWAEEWKIRRRRRRMITAVIVIIAVFALGHMINYISILGSRTTFSSEEEMREAMQGRFVTDYAEDIVIDGDRITLTYYNQSHYDLDYAEKYGYSEYGDSVYEDTIVKWDHRKGEIKGEWMDAISLDREGNLVYYSQTYRKTDEPKPTPIDPSDLSLYKQGYSDSEAASQAAGESPEEAQGEAQAAEESQTETQAAAEDAGVEALSEDEPQKTESD